MGRFKPTLVLLLDYQRPSTSPHAGGSPGNLALPKAIANECEYSLTRCCRSITYRKHCVQCLVRIHSAAPKVHLWPISRSPERERLPAISYPKICHAYYAVYSELSTPLSRGMGLLVPTCWLGVPRKPLPTDDPLSLISD